MIFDNVNGRLPEDLCDVIDYYFKSDLTRELAGLVYPAEDDLLFRPLPTVSTVRHLEIDLNDNEWEEVIDICNAGGYIAHSHIQEPHETRLQILGPSINDIKLMAEIGKYATGIIFTYDLKKELAARCLFGLASLHDSLLGRHFIPGFYDCFSLMKSYECQKKGHVIKTLPRNYQTMTDAEELHDAANKEFREYYTEIKNLDEISAGDIILFNYQRPFIDHCGVYIGNETLLDHKMKKKSGYSSLRQLKHRIREVWRYEG